MICNNGGGRIPTVDIETGAVRDLYTECNGHPLITPNDIVFDEHGGFYSTGHASCGRGGGLIRHYAPAW